MKEIGLMTCSMDKDWKLGIVEQLSMKDNFIKEKRTEKEDFHGKMEVTTRVILLMDSSKDLVFTSLQILIRHIKVNLE